MKLNLKKEFNNNRTMILFSVVALLAGIASSLFYVYGFIFLPVTSAFIVALFMFDKSRMHPYALCSSLIILIFDLALTLALGRVYSFAVLASVIVAGVVCFYMSRGWRKSECAAINTIIVSVFSVLFVFAIVFVVLGDFNFATALDYLNDLMADKREYFVDSLLGVLNQNSEVTDAVIYTEEQVGALIDGIMNYLISYVVICAFLLIGLMHKLLSALIRGFSDNRESADSWRFVTSSVFAYFYLILFLICMFVGGEDVFALSVNNLYMIFTYVYAYIGFNIVKAFIVLRTGRSLIAYVVLFISILLLSSMAIELLAIIGALMVIFASGKKVVGLPPNDDNMS